MNYIYLFPCWALVTVMARVEPPVFMGLQQQNQRALPLNAYAVDPHIYQELPEEHSFAGFGANPSVVDGLVTVVPKTNNNVMVHGDSYNAAYHHSFSQRHENGYENGPTETQIHKHIYVHVPPKDFEEEDAIQPRVKHQGGRKQKHYKIVFIKAPTVPEMHAPIVPPAPQSEEKTLIYVLHKKPETVQDIVIPTPEPTKPSKPEVYFIKYKTKKDEAPVYGPPPATNEIQVRQGANGEGNSFMPMDVDHYESLGTTQQPQYQNHQERKPQFVNESPTVVGSDLYSAPSDEIQPTTAEHINQYLPPETTQAPIVVKEMDETAHVPVSTYGAPKRSRFFIKRRK